MKESRGITPLRTILQNCLNHIENLETNRSICDNYDKEFQDLKQFSETLKVQKEFSCTEGEKEVNRKKNRYKDILPFNVSRVVLSEYAGIPGSDYINANYIKGASGSPAYIASQGPLPNTVNDFWRMVVECEVQVIVMACNAQESGKHKCENYWVEKEGEEKRFGMVQICLVKASTVCPDFLVRTMRLKYTNDKDVTEERTVCQFHYSAWPDHGVPPLVRPLLDMVRLVRDTQASETLPVLVHCSAGCGRTGTICAIDFVWGLLRAGKLTEEFSLFNLVKEMRKQRVAMVQTKEQYILVHQAVRELFKEQLRVIESHPYENIDFNGVPLIKDFEEPFYDTICIQKDENCDEKQDKSELKEKGEDPERSLTKIDPPPLPRKKRPNVLFSKQEKEAENLTEKNRSSFVDKEKEKERTDASLSSLLGKPRIVKLRSLFEKSPTVKERTGLKDRGSQTVSRSHSLGAIRKPLTSEIFDSHAERKMSSALSQPPTPTTTTTTTTTNITIAATTEPGKLKNSKSFSKSVPLIKRSKSLKTFTQSSNLCISPPNAVERKCLKYHQPKSNEMDGHGSNDNEHSWQKTNCDLGQASGSTRECSRRRRSLESLMGDYPHTITWPTVVMTVEKDGSNVKSRPKTCNWSPKVNSNTIQGSKTADILKHQLQRLSLETEKKMNSFVSGIGVRERRNSFRQAVTKSDFQTILRDYRDQKCSSGKKPTGSENFLVLRDNLHSKVSKNSNEVSHAGDQADGSVFIEREGLVKSKCVFDTKKYKLPDKGSLVGEAGAQLNKINSRHPSQGNSSGPSTSQLVLEPRLNKAVMSSKSRAEECDKNGEYKNLFLKKLNSEMLSDRDCGNNLQQQHNEARSRSNYEELEKPKIVRFPSGSILGQSDSKKGLFKTNISVKPTGSYVVNSDGLDEVDGSNGRFERPVEMESIPSTWQNSSLQSHQSYLKPAKPAKPFDCYKCYTTPMPAHSTLYNRTNPGYKVPTYQNSVVENNLRREEGPHEVRSKESFFPIPQKKNVCCVVPTKGPSNHESEIASFGSYRKNPGMSSSDLYVAINPEFDNNDKKLMLPSKMAGSDKSNKGFDCLPWSHSNSSRNSGEMSSSDSSIQHSLIPESSRLLGQSDTSKSETKGIKKAEQGKGIGKTRLNESSSKITQSNQPCSSSSKQKKSEELKSSSSVEFCNRGVVNTSKVRQNVPKYSKDDFVLDEPTAPPRVKRHASVTVPRNTLNGSNHVSAWVSSEKKLVGDRNSVRQVDKNAWSGSTFGVDLDAVAASMQQEKREPTVLKEGIWSSKNHLSISNSSNVKKKQHYF